MPRDPFSGYDAWLEKPYQERADESECPECGCGMLVDRRERTVECTECGYSDGFDWDAEAERRAEAMVDEMEDRYGDMEPPW